jgi:ATP-dependent protease Clp ATPase subunit
MRLTVFAAKSDVYSIDTTNVLFILSGAFVGLEDIIKQRVAKGVGLLNSIGRFPSDGSYAVNRLYSKSRGQVL